MKGGERRREGGSKKERGKEGGREAGRDGGRDRRRDNITFMFMR